VASVKNINLMCATGYPTSGAAAAPTAIVVHQETAVAYKRARFVSTGVTVPQITDLPSDVSATTSERRT
jgi:hypothetical protein